MKLRVKKSTTIISSCLTLVAFLGVAAYFASTSVSPAQAQSSGGRLITVHDRGVTATFLSTKDNLKEALEENGITVNEKDAVEPAVDEKLVAPEYQVNIYRARPVTVVDGGIRQKIVTPYQSPERIVKDAGIELHKEDAMSLSRSSDIVADGAGLELSIDRAIAVTLDLYGSITEVRTQGATVAELLKEKNIKLGDSGRASLPLTAAVTEGMSLRIWREGKQTVTAEESIAFETEQVKDADREVGYKEVTVEGQDGLRSVTYEIEIKDGVEVSRTEIASLTTKDPVKRVEVVGTKSKHKLYTGGGSMTEWLAASNIPAESWGYAQTIVARESGWNPNAINKSSGACGLAQALPCSKLGPDWANPVVALNWMNSYVNGRYYDGSPYVKGGICSGMTSRWQCADAFWQRNRWY